MCNVTGQMHELDEVMPEFYAPLENWTVTQGRDVYFTCTVNNLGKYKVINKRSIYNNIVLETTEIVITV